MVQFEWDDEKANRNYAKHGASFHEAATVFGDALSWTYPDPDHSESEQRWISVGISEQQRLLVVGYTERSGRLRIVNARPATRKERRHYEET